VPVPLQANKSLLMKAMQQAEQSVAKARQHLVSTAPVPVTSAKTQQTDRHVSKAVKSSEPDSEKLTLMTVKHSTVADVKTTGRDHAATLTSSDLRRSLVSLPSSDITQLVCRSASQPSVVGQPSDESARVQTDVMTEESLDLMEQDEDSLDSEEDGLRQLLLLQQTNTRLGQRAGSPKFVVTLDGASESLSEMDTIDTDTLLASSVASARNVVRVKPQTQPLARLQEGSLEDDVPAASTGTAAKLRANERPASPIGAAAEQEREQASVEQTIPGCLTGSPYQCQESYDVTPMSSSSYFGESHVNRLQSFVDSGC